MTQPSSNDLSEARKLAAWLLHVAEDEGCVEVDCRDVRAEFPWITDYMLEYDDHSGGNTTSESQKK